MDSGFRYKQCLTIRTELAAVLIQGLYRWDPTRLHFLCLQVPSGISKHEEENVSMTLTTFFLKLYHVVLNLMIDFQSILFASLTVFSDLSFWKHALPPIIFFYWKHYNFLLCKWSRSASLMLFSPPFPKLSVLLKGNSQCILMPFLF